MKISELKEILNKYDDGIEIYFVSDSKLIDEDDVKVSFAANYIKSDSEDSDRTIVATKKEMEQTAKDETGISLSGKYLDEYTIKEKWEMCLGLWFFLE